MKQQPKKIYSLFQPLKLQLVEQPEEDSESDSEDDDEEVPLSFLAQVKPQSNQTYTALKKRNRQEESQGQQAKKKCKQHPPANAKASTSTQSRSMSQLTLSFQITERKPKSSDDEKQKVAKDAEGDYQAQNQDVSSSENSQQQGAIHHMDQNEKTSNEDNDPGSEEKPPSAETVATASLGANEIVTKTNSPRRKLLRRIVSKESAIEFIPKEKQKGPSFLSQLVHRSCRGTKITSQVSQPRRWKSPSWVSLSQTRSSGEPGRSIDHLAWDKMGVLLAVASDKWIRVYDWDMVRAADMHGKNDRIRQIKDSEFKIPPILEFRVPNPVATLEWNPHNEDQLAVGLRVSGHVHLYNVDRISTWLSKHPRNAALVPPERTYIRLSYPRTSGSASTVHFLDPQTVFVGIGTTVYCWKLQKDMTSLIWRYEPPASISCVAPFGSNLLLLGTNRGHLCLLNWKKYTRERAFSAENRPIVIQEWIPHAKLKSLNQEQRNRMGIIKMKVETNPRISENKTPWGCCRISWVTSGGWLLSSVVESPMERGDCQICHATPVVQYLNPDGTSTETKKQEWSQPQDPIGVCTNSRMICWSDVPAVTKILPHHNKYVLDTQRQIVRCGKRALLYRDEGTTHSIKLPGKDMPQTVAIHPGLEWIVMGVGKKLILLVGRR